MKRLGILGGMGPLASAEFLQTLYRLNLAEPEQDSPRCLLDSDPSFPDRTEAILTDTWRPLLEQLVRRLRDLERAGADVFVVTCVTAHALLPRLPHDLRAKVVSLLDLVVDEVLARPRRRLLLATRGTRRARVFDAHERWEQVRRWVALPDEEEQTRLHEWIYRLKRCEPPEGFLPELAALAARHDVEGFIFGCTEFHLLHRPLAAGAAVNGRFDVVDPLVSFAHAVPRLLAGERGRSAQPAPAGEAAEEEREFSAGSPSTSPPPPRQPAAGAVSSGERGSCWSRRRLAPRQPSRTADPPRAGRRSAPP